MALAVGCLGPKQSVRELLLELPRSEDWLVLGPRLAGDSLLALARRTESSAEGARATPSFLERLAIRGQEANDENPGAIIDIGVYQLLRGKFDLAIAKLEWGVSIERSAANLNDLAVAYLRQAQVENQPMSLLLALETAHEASQIDASSPDALFNKALALSRLHLVSSAAAAWRDFLEIEPSGPWAEDVRDARSSLSEDAFLGRWQEIESGLRASGARANDLVGDATRDYPDRLERFCERDVLRSWAESILADDGERAAFHLELADRIADSLAENRGDVFLLDEVTGIHATMESAALLGTLRERARGVLHYLDGLELYESRSLASGQVDLEASQALLQRSGSPLALAAELYLATSREFASNAYARRALQALAHRVPDEYLALRGRINWSLGLNAAARRQFEESLAFYREAERLLEASGGPNAAAAIKLLLAEALDLRGEIERGWQERLKALSQLSHFGSPQRRYGVVIEAAQALVRGNRDELALYFLDEGAAAAEAYGLGMARIEVQLARGETWIRQGRESKVVTVLQETRAILESLEDNGLKTRLTAHADLLEGLALLSSDPAAALELLDRHRSRSDPDFRYLELDDLAARATANERLRHPDEARRILARAVATFDETRKNATDFSSSVRSFLNARTTFDRLIRLSLDATDDRRLQAFSWVERARGQSILDRWRARAGHREPSQGPPDAEEIAKTLEPGTVLIEYALIQDTIHCWVLQTGRVRHFELPTAAAQIEELSAQFLRSIRNNAREPLLRSQGKRLYRELLQPLQIDLDGVSHLIVAPDGSLASLPLSTLVDPQSDQFLIQRTAVSTVPSASLYVLAKQASTPFPAQPALLAVGVDEIPEGPYSYLPSLPAARREVAALEDQFSAQALIGENATKQRILERLRTSDAFHFSGHALSSGGEWNSSALVLQGTNDGTALLRTSDLLAAELERLRFVTLSACGTLGGYDAGREGLLSLATAFFASGVPSVAGALWPVDDTLAADLMTRFYREAPGAPSAAEALRRAILAWIESEPERASPAAWGAFGVLGI